MGPIVLIGFMGCGKTAVASVLASVLNLKHIDLDKLIEEKENKSITQIFSENGEKYFRDTEAKNLVLLPHGRYVLSIGGGAVLRSDNVDELKKRKVTIVYLKARKNTIKKRLSGKYDTRPLLNKVDDIDKYIDNTIKMREPTYVKVADFTIKTDNLTIEQVADKIVRKLNELSVN